LVLTGLVKEALTSDLITFFTGSTRGSITTASAGGGGADAGGGGGTGGGGAGGFRGEGKGCNDGGAGLNPVEFILGTSKLALGFNFNFSF